MRKPPPAANTPDTRTRLLDTALRLFADHGFAGTSTRDIAEGAQANIGAIAYYFGDKAGLYRAAFTEPMGTPADDIALFDGPELSLEQALTGLYSGFTEPLKLGELARRCTKLHLREMVEPTGLWNAEIDHSIAPYIQALHQLLCRHFGINKPDAGVQRLAQAIVALGVHLYLGRDVSDRMAPALLGSPKAIDEWRDTCVRLGLAMVQAEMAHRRQAKKK